MEQSTLFVPNQVLLITNNDVTLKSAIHFLNELKKFDFGDEHGLVTITQHKFTPLSLDNIQLQQSQDKSLSPHIIRIDLQVRSKLPRPRPLPLLLSTLLAVKGYQEKLKNEKLVLRQEKMFGYRRRSLTRASLTPKRQLTVAF